MTDCKGDLQAHNAKVREWQPIEDAKHLDRQKVLAPINGKVLAFTWDAQKFHKKPKPFWNNREFGAVWSRAHQPTMFQYLPEPPKE